MKRRLFIVTFHRRFVRRLSWLIVLVALSAWTTVLWYGSARSPLGPESQGMAVTVAISAEPLRLDPHDARDAPSSLVNYHVYDRLVELDADGKIVPSLARSWRISPDGLEYTFTLQDGVLFHDGLSLDAQAVVFNFQRLLSAEPPPSRAELIRPYVESVEAPDLKTVVFRLRQPLAPFLHYLAHESLGIVSPRSIQRLAAGEPFQPIGTGPFSVADWTPGQGVTLAAFPHHWRGRPPVDRLIFRPIPDGSSRLIALETGAADVAFPIEPVHLSRLRRQRHIRVVQAPTQRVIYAALNLRRAPLDSPAFRQALNYAVDVDAIARRLLFGVARPLDSPLARSTWGSAAVSPYRYDPQTAKALLEESGGADRPLELWGPSSRYVLDREVAQAIAGYLRDAGLEVTIRLYEWGTYLALLSNTDEWDLAILGWVPASGEADMGLRPIYHSQSRGNHSSYRSPTVDGLLDEALYSLDETKRLELYKQAQEMIANDAPSLFLYSLDLVAAHRWDIEGLVVHETEIIDLRWVRRRSIVPSLALFSLKRSWGPRR